MLIVLKHRLRYISNPLLSHGMANIEIYTQHALRSYLQDKQAHEKLALKLQVATANENARQDEDKTKEKPRSPEA